MPSKDSMCFFISSEFSDRVPQVVKVLQAREWVKVLQHNSQQTGESPVPIPEMLSGFLRLAPQKRIPVAMRITQSRLSVPANPRQENRAPSSLLEICQRWIPIFPGCQ